MKYRTFPNDADLWWQRFSKCKTITKSKPFNPNFTQRKENPCMYSALCIKWFAAAKQSQKLLSCWFIGIKCDFFSQLSSFDVNTDKSKASQAAILVLPVIVWKRSYPINNLYALSPQSILFCPKLQPRNFLLPFNFPCWSHIMCRIFETVTCLSNIFNLESRKSIFLPISSTTMNCLIWYQISQHFHNMGWRRKCG